MSVYDVKEELINNIRKHDVNIHNALGGFVLESDGDMGVSDLYISLDSKLKNSISNPAMGEFSFDINYHTAQTINSIWARDSLSDMIDMEIYPFYIPVPQQIEFSTAVTQTSTLPRLVSFVASTSAQLSPLDPLVIMEIKELGLRSISDPDRDWHSFEFKHTETTDGRFLLLEPTNLIYNFTDLTEHINTITLRFRNYSGPLSFLEDSYKRVLPTFTVSGSDNFLTFNIPNHGLVTGERVHIDNFNVRNPVINNYIKRKEGHLIGFVDANSFRLNPDVDLSPVISGGSFNGTPDRCDIFVDNRRIKIMMKFRKMLRRVTNYKAP